MAEKTYWLADPEGTRAPVQGAEARDHLVQVSGWTESTEPERGDFVWVRNEDSALGATRMTWEAAQLDAWAGRGWTPGLPADGLPVTEPAAAAPKSSPTKSAASGDKIKE